MIKLMINGEKVNLAADLSLEFYARNPFFTSEGQHTLDIDISLADPQNARVYRSMHRIDVGSRPKNRSAVLYYEKGVIISGTEVILEIDTKTVKIQIVAGNSEFNFIAGSDKRLHELDLGSIPTIDEATALASMQGSYPQWDYVCTPVCAKVTFRIRPENVMHSGFKTYNNSTICNEIELATDKAALKYKAGTRLCPQPYLAAIVRKVLQALGYTPKDYYLAANKELSRLVVVHAHDTLYYNRMVENWTVEEFLSQVENLCAVYFVVDNFSKTVSIMNAAKYYKTAEVEHIAYGDVIGDVDKKYDQDPPDNIVYHNVSYKFPSTNLYKFSSIDHELMGKLQTVLCPSGTPPYDWWKASLYYVYKAMIGDDGFYESKTTPQAVKDVFNKNTIYKLLPSLMEESVYEYPFVLAGCTDNFALLKMVNQFGPRIEDNSDDKMELNLVPAEQVWCNRSSNSNAGKGVLIYPLPLAENTDSDEASSTEDTAQGVLDKIYDGEKSETISDTMFLAFYLGIQPEVYGHPAVTPLCVNSRLLQYSTSHLYTDSLFWGHQRLYYINVEGNFDLSINGSKGMYNTYWVNQLDVDFSEVYIIRFRSLQLRDARHIFNICNRKFYCQQLKYGVVNGHLSDVIEGTFYPVR